MLLSKLQDAEEAKISRYKERYDIYCKIGIYYGFKIASLQRGHEKGRDGCCEACQYYKISSFHYLGDK